MRKWPAEHDTVNNFGTGNDTNTGCESRRDYSVTNNSNTVRNFVVLNPDIDFSDHRPVAVECSCIAVNIRLATMGRFPDGSDDHSAEKMTAAQLRLDHADLLLYRSDTALNSDAICVR